MKLVLFDPSLKDNHGTLSDNLGDVIIYEFVEKVLAEIFPSVPILRIATHTLPDTALKQKIHPEDLCFLGGSNILNSTVNIYNNWNFDKNFFETLFSARLNVVTLGVGWGEYQGPPGFYSKLFYKKRLSPSKIHSVRDSYSLSQLQKIRSMKAVNTGCPTTWWLEGVHTHRQGNKSNKTCLFTLTDYSKDVEKDSELIKTLLENFDELIFFPQGFHDLNYICSLEIYKHSKNKIFILKRELKSFKGALKKGEVVYIGTRLHAGILALNYGIESLIISIDNRAREMAKDIHLPVAERNAFGRITQWIKGEKIFSHDTILTSQKEISVWKKQFDT